METNLVGRIRNTTLPYTSGLLPLFEAVVNSIHALGERGIPSEKGRIIVEILRKQKTPELGFDDRKGKKGPEPAEEIIGFRVTDNGIGFTDENMKSFDTLDSSHKEHLGCRGIGRLLWLKAFQNVRVDSLFHQGDKLVNRRFIFNAGGVSDQKVTEVPNAKNLQTVVELDGFRQVYRDRSRKTLNPIAISILEHCLWYFIRPGGAPDIQVFDDGQSVNLQALFDEDTHSAAVSEKIDIRRHCF